MELHYCTDLGFYWVDESGRVSQVFEDWGEAMLTRYVFDDIVWQKESP